MNIYSVWLRKRKDTLERGGEGYKSLKVPKKGGTFKLAGILVVFTLLLLRR